VAEAGIEPAIFRSTGRYADHSTTSAALPGRENYATSTAWNRYYISNRRYTAHGDVAGWPIDLVRPLEQGYTLGESIERNFRMRFRVYLKLKNIRGQFWTML